MGNFFSFLFGFYGKGVGMKAQQFLYDFFYFCFIIFVLQGNKFSVSPRKLRSMLLGLEKRNQEEGGEQPTTTDQEIIHSKEVPQSDNRRMIKSFIQFN